MTNKSRLEKIFKNKIYAVFNFAAQAGVRYSIKNPRAYIESNTLGFFNVIELSIKNNIKKIFSDGLKPADNNIIKWKIRLTR